MEQHSQENMSVENWVRIYSQINQEPESQYDYVEALSLCDLATNEPDHPEQSNNPQQCLFDEPEPDFAFGSSGSTLSHPDNNNNSNNNNNMSSADELFFRGQILPLRHSVTLPSRLMTRPNEFIFTRSISISISEPVSTATSRSSSARSSTSVSEFNGYRTRNQFHSYPSPTPHIRTRIRNFRQSNRSTSKWRFLQLGPLKPEEIGLSDLKNRSQIGYGRGNIVKDEEDKKKQVLSFVGCKCSTDVIESTVSSRISMVKPMTLNEEETGSKESNIGRRKHVVSGNRTSEWSKQFFFSKK